IWPYHQKYAANILKEYGQETAVFADFREFLAGAKDLDAVLIATPDWVHAEPSIACLKAGRHVYCEKEMATTVADARAMVAASRAVGKLLQIGHQRRSNPRYRHADAFVNREHLLGRVTHAYGQWNRARALEQGWPKAHVLDADTLKRYGYDSMERFRNWRWYKKFSSGPIADLGSHQVDIFTWFLRANPEAVLATGGGGYYPGREWPDHVMAIYEYKTAAGPVRAFYQVLNTTSHGGYYEAFMGDAGSLEISEDPKVGHFFRETVAEKAAWEDDAERVLTMGKEAIELKVGETRKADGRVAENAFQLEEDAKKPVHQPHLENFFAAIRGRGTLSSPAAEAFATTVAILKTNEAVAAGCRVPIAPRDFIA
ncbi:MAG: Gfo/Idh/MocA family oxidoreductase, partial [bacterium]